MKPAPDALHEGLREPWAHCESVRAELVAVLEPVDAVRWETAPGPGRWTLAQQADHVLRAEIGTSKLVRRLIRGDYQGVTVPEGAELYGSTLKSYPFEATTAPPVLQPERLPHDEALEQLQAAHERFLEELQRFRGDDADAPIAPDPASPLWFTLGGWVRVQALHEAHHLRQMRETVAALG